MALDIVIYTEGVFSLYSECSVSFSRLVGLSSEILVNNHVVKQVYVTIAI